MQFSHTSLLSVITPRRLVLKRLMARAFLMASGKCILALIQAPVNASSGPNVRTRTKVESRPWCQHQSAKQ
jgi:hypothetical protein